MKRIFSLLLAMLLVFGVADVSGVCRGLSDIFAIKASAVNESILSYAPQGTRDLALDAGVVSSSPYEGSNGWWSVSNINDGQLQNSTGGFTTSTQEKDVTQDTPAWIIFDLEGYYDLNRIAFFPYGAFPDSFRTEVSLDGEAYTTVDTQTGKIGNTKVLSVDISAQRARFVRVYITKRGRLDGNPIHLVQFAEIAIFGRETAACTPVVSDLTTFAPDNTINLSPESEPSASSSYEPNDGKWSVKYLVDGTPTGKGFSSTLPSMETGETEPLQIDFDLKQYADLKRIVLFRYGILPRDFTIQLSTDGINYETAAAYTDVAYNSPAYIIADLPQNSYARYVRIDVTRRNRSSVEGYYTQFGEIAIYGVKNAFQTSFDKIAVTLLPGEEITVTNTVKIKYCDNYEHTTQWSSLNEAVATINENGKITAVGYGVTKVMATDSVSGIRSECEVTVREKKYDCTDGIKISVMGPPWGDIMTDEQFRFMSEAGIDIVFNSGGTRAVNKKAIELAHGNGMQNVIRDTDIARNPLAITSEELQGIYDYYKNLSGFGGVFLLDEPKNPNLYAKTYNRIKEIDPELYVHLNFLPGFVYDSYEQYQYQLEDFANLTVNTDYLMFDYYPFRFNGSTSYAEMFDSYNAVRKAGLRTDTKTAAYIQAVGYGLASQTNFSKRVPTASDILYQDMVSLAYGAKQISYFLWTGDYVGASEKFSPGAITSNGEKTDNYYAIQSADSKVHNLGLTLCDLDAENVYISGTDAYGQDRVPSDFFVHAPDAYSLIFSHMVSRIDGKNYLMVVNNDLQNSVSVPLTFVNAISSVRVFDYNGAAWSNRTVNGALSLNIEAGGAALIDLGGYVYSPVVADNVDLALHKRVSATTSLGENGWYIGALTDGYVEPNTAKGLNGWCSEFSDTSYETDVVVDLGKITTFNSVTLRPASASTGYDVLFPKGYTVSVSADGEVWTEIAAESNAASGSKNYKFNAIEARYIKLNVTEMNSLDGEFAAALSEIEASSQAKVVRVKTVPDGVNGYYAYAFCEGEDLVKMPTWTTSGGQDDIIWYIAEKGDWTIEKKSYNYRCYIPVSEHKNELGTYNTHVYAYNEFGNHAVAAIYDFKCRVDFDVNYGGLSRNYLSGLNDAPSGGGLTTAYNSASESIVINGTQTSSLVLTKGVIPFDYEFSVGDKITVTVDILSGTSSNAVFVFDLDNGGGTGPLGVRKNRDFRLGQSEAWTYTVPDQSVADDIYGYKLWLYRKDDLSAQTFENCELRIKIEINGQSDIYLPQSKTVGYGDSYGYLCRPERYDADFLGWYTLPDGGTRVTEDTVNRSVGTQTLYAHWQEAGTEYLYGLRPMLTKAELENDYIDINGGTVVYPDSNADIISTGTLIEILDTDTGKLLKRYIAVLFGDVDRDGKYDGTDAVLVGCLADNMLACDDVGNAAYIAADCNRDGVIDALDAELLQQASVLLGMIDQSASYDELKTNSVYVEYLELIDQTPGDNAPVVSDDGEENVQPNVFGIAAIIKRVIKFIIAFVGKIICKL